MFYFFIFYLMNLKLLRLWTSWFKVVAPKVGRYVDDRNFLISFFLQNFTNCIVINYKFIYMIAIKYFTTTHFYQYFEIVRNFINKLSDCAIFSKHHWCELNRDWRCIIYQYSLLSNFWKWVFLLWHLYEIMLGNFVKYLHLDKVVFAVYIQTANTVRKGIWAPPIRRKLHYTTYCRQRPAPVGTILYSTYNYSNTRIIK